MRYERRRTPFLRRHAVFAAVLIAAFFASAAPRPAAAIGEPTLAISMDSLSIGTGTTAGVTFTFSSPPLGFDNADVDLTSANGSLSTIAPTADARVFTATFTPNPGVNNDSSRIVVGVQWTDGGGVAPLGPSSSPFFAVHTAAASGSGCPAPSVSLASPNGGELFQAGQSVDVFWTVNGCQATSIALALSTDGGETFAPPFATVADPFSGYFPWIVPDLGSGIARLRASLLGQGGVVLASDLSDGDFAIAAIPSAAPETPPPASATATAGPTGSAPAPGSPGPTSTGQPAPSADAAPVPDGASSQGSAPPESPPASTPPAETAPTPTPSASVTTQRPKPPLATPSAPARDAQSTPVENPIPSTSPMPATNDNQNITVENARDAVVSAASGYVPSPITMAYSFATGAISMLTAVLGTQKILRDKKTKNTRPCRHCRGTGREAAESKGPGTCGDCKGTGMVEDEEEQSTECPHCKGEGEDPCHVCKGTGKDASGGECKACRGEGVALEDPEDEDSEAKECEICRGEGEVSATIKKMVKCDACGGTGRV